MRDLEPKHSNSVKVVETRNVWRDAQAKRRAEPGGTVASYVSESMRADDLVHVRLNGEYVARDRWDSRRVASGSVVEAYRVERRGSGWDWANVLLFGWNPIGIATGAGQSFKEITGIRSIRGLFVPEAPDLGEQRSGQSGTYSGTLIQTTSGSGVPRSRVIGLFLAAGHVIQEFTGSTSGESSPGGTFRIAAYNFKSVATVDYGLGPYKSIAGIVADVDELHLPENAPVGGTLLNTDDLFINGQKVQEYAGLGSVGVRLGRNFQAPPMSSLKVNREQSIGTTIEPSEPGENLTVTGTSIEEVTGLGFNFFFTPGFWHVKTAGSKAGQREPVPFYIKVRIKPKDAAAWVIDETVAAHTVQNGVFLFKPNGVSVRIDFQKQNPKHAGLWGSRVDFSLEWGVPTGWKTGFYVNVVGKAQLLSLSEYTDVRSQSFPGRATVTFDMSIPDLSGQPNRFQALIEGAEMSLIDPDAPESEQLFGWTDDGADIFQDFVTHEAYLGDVYGAENIHLPSFAECKGWNREMVDDGEGGKIKRWALNGVIDQFKPEDQHLRAFCAAMGASYWFDGYQFRIVIDREEDVTQVFSIFGMGGIRQGSLERFDVFEQIFTAVDVRFRDEAMDYQYNTATWEDPDEQGNRLTRTQIELTYVTNYARAYHIAERFGLKMKYENEGFEFEVGFPAVNSTPGNVIGLHHQLPYWSGISGLMRRNAPGAALGMYLDQDLTIDAAEPLQVFVKTTGTGQEVPQIRDVVSAPGFYPANTLINVNPSWDAGDLPQADDQYMIGPALNANNMRGPARLYRIQEISRSDDTWAKLRVTKYDKRAYPKHHRRLKVNRPEPVPQRGDIPPNVRDLTVKFVQNPMQNNQRTGTSGVEVRWTKSQWKFDYNCAVFFRMDDIEPKIFHLLPDFVEGESFFYDNVIEGTRITVAVTPISADGRNKRAAQVCPQASFTVPIVGGYVPEIVP